MNRTVVIAGIYIIIIAGILLAISLGLQKPETTLVQELGVSAQVTAEVNKYITIKILSSDKRVSVYVPPNAIKNDGYLVLTSLEPNLFTDPNSEWDRPIVVNLDLYNMQGKLIRKPNVESVVDICFLLSDEESAKFIDNRDNYFIQYYEDKQGVKEWIPINYSTRSDSKQRCGEINHLTLFSLAIQGVVPNTNPSFKPYQFPIK